MWLEQDLSQLAVYIMCDDSIGCEEGGLFCYRSRHRIDIVYKDDLDED